MGKRKKEKNSLTDAKAREILNENWPKIREVFNECHSGDLCEHHANTKFFPIISDDRNKQVGTFTVFSSGKIRIDSLKLKN